MGKWLWNDTDIASIANGGRYAVEHLHEDSAPKLANDAPRLLMRVGRPQVTRWPDTRKVDLGIVVWGEDAATAENRLLALKGLLAVGSVGTLGQEFYDGRLLTMRAQVAGFETTWKAPQVYRVAIQVESVGEPYFRDTQAITTTATITAQTAPYQVAFTHENPGLEDRGFIIRFHGPATNPKLLSAADSGLWCGVNEIISAGNYVEMRVATFEVVWKTGSAVNPANIVHSGDRYFFVLQSGMNDLVFGADDTGGMIEIVQTPPY